LLCRYSVQMQNTIGFNDVLITILLLHCTLQIGSVGTK
jgi:hypothetical protein